MPVAKPREVATPTPTGQEGAPAPAAAHRGRRLGKGARRDIRWALRQHPGDDVREIMLHGVKIRFHSGPTDKDGTREREASPQGGCNQVRSGGFFSSVRFTF